jgi:hypothetical protein
MQFDEFVLLIDAAIRETTAVESGRENGTATWSARSRTAEVALVPPLNVSVSLDGAETRWYPIAQALVPVVSRRIASFLSEG